MKQNHFQDNHPNIVISGILGNTISKLMTRELLFAVFAFAAIFLPSIIHQQAITGPLVNAVLLLSTVWLGSSDAIIIGLFPSVVALSRGLLPLPLAPVVPFIMLANSLYILVFSKVINKAKKGCVFKNFSLAVASASVVKFIFLFFVSQKLLPTLLPQKFVTPASQMMSWPQLATALLGGLIAYAVLKSFFSK